jgi:hypothetical protein
VLFKHERTEADNDDFFIRDYMPAFNNLPSLSPAAPTKITACLDAVVTSADSNPTEVRLLQAAESLFLLGVAHVVDTGDAATNEDLGSSRWD